MKKAILFLCFSMAMQAQDIKVVSGRLERHPEFKSQYVAARDVAVWLPDGYSQKETYDVLYMHDGQALFDANTNWNKQEWRVDDVAGQLIAGKKTRPFIVVAIWNSGATRHSDYFPQKPFESLTQKQKDSLYALGGAQPLFAAKVGSDNYLKFIVKELMPFVEHTYSVKKGKEHTFVAGSSMGGLISMYALCEYPDVFGGAACLSTHWIGTFETKDNPIPKAFQNYLKRNLPSPMTHKIYFDYGDQTLDAVYEPYQKEVDLILMAKGYDARNWTTQKFPGAEHAEHSWAERLDIPLMFLLGR